MATDIPHVLALMEPSVSVVDGRHFPPYDVLPPQPRLTASQASSSEFDD
jgi:hypothetical protein